jgi:hypothetical protein
MDSALAMARAGLGFRLDMARVGSMDFPPVLARISRTASGCRCSYGWARIYRMDSAYGMARVSTMDFAAVEWRKTWVSPHCDSHHGGGFRTRRGPRVGPGFRRSRGSQVSCGFHRRYGPPKLSGSRMVGDAFSLFYATLVARVSIMGSPGFRWLACTFWFSADAMARAFDMVVANTMARVGTMDSVHAFGPLWDPGFHWSLGSQVSHGFRMR